MANTLSDYYKSQGQALPSVNKRKTIAAQAGISNYAGTADQNNQLLGYLQKTPKVLSPEQITPGTPVNLPTPQPTPAQKLTNQAEDFLSATEVAPTDTQNQADSLSMRLAELSTGLYGQTQALADKEAELGVQENKKALAELSGQIKTRGAEYDAIISGVEGQGRGITTGIVASKQNKLIREKASEIGLLNARAQAVQGNIAAAQEEAARAVELKYAPIKEEIEIRRLQLEAIEPILNREQKEQARKQQIKDNLAMNEIQKAEDEEKRVRDLSLTLASNQAPNELVQKAFQANSLSELMIIPGIQNYLQSPLEKLQMQKYSQDMRIAKAEFEQVLNEAATPGLTVKERKELLKDPTTKQASARIGIIKAMGAYKQEVANILGATGPAGVTKIPTKAQLRKLETALNTTIGSAINVAQGQGAMGDQEAQRILGNLRVTRFKRPAILESSANGVIDAQKSLLDNDLSFIESSYPGATQSFQLFNDYLTSESSDEEFFNSQSTLVPSGNYFNF